MPPSWFCIPLKAWELEITFTSQQQREQELYHNTSPPQLRAFVKTGQDIQKLQKLLNFSSSPERAQMGIGFIFSVSKIGDIRFNSKPDENSSSDLMFFHERWRVALLQEGRKLNCGWYMMDIVCLCISLVCYEQMFSKQGNVLGNILPQSKSSCLQSFFIPLMPYRCPPRWLKGHTTLCVVLRA